MGGDRDAEKLRFIEGMGLTPGTVLTVVKRQPFNGPVTVKLHLDETVEHVLGYELAQGLSCVATDAAMDGKDG